MNYMMVQKTGDDVTKPCRIIQMFTDEEMMLLAQFVEDALDRDIYEPGQRVAHTFVHLMMQWEDETL